MATRTYEIKEDDTIKIGGHKIIDDEKWFLKSKKTYKREDGDRTFGKYQKQGAFSATAEKIGKKMDAVLNDSNKTTKLLMALNTITESSKMEPLSSGRVKTPLGKITSGITKGLIQGKQIQSAETLSKAKLRKAEQGPTKINLKPTAWETTDIADITAYNKAYANEMTTAIDKDNRYTLLQQYKDYPVTGRVQKMVLPFREFFEGIKTIFSDDAMNAFLTMDAAKINELDSKEIIKFQQELQAYTMNLVIGKAKNLYPVSENDVQRLLDAAGNIGTISAALKTLVSLDKAALEMQQLYKEGVTIYRTQNPESTTGKVTAEGATGTDWRSFAKNYAETKILENHEGVDQAQVNNVYQGKVQLDSLSPLQIASVGWSQGLLSFDLGAADTAVLATWQQEARDAEKKLLESILNN